MRGRRRRRRRACVVVVMLIYGLFVLDLFDQDSAAGR